MIVVRCTMIIITGYPSIDRLSVITLGHEGYKPYIKHKIEYSYKLTTELLHKGVFHDIAMGCGVMQYEIKIATPAVSQSSIL